MIYNLFVGESSEIPGVSYSLSRADFSGPKPQNPADNYTLGERFSRDNFAAFIVDSFSKSRGIPTAQVAIFSWLEANTGLDYKSTLDNFLEEGGTKCLSQTEVNLLLRAFGEVKMHAKETKKNTLYLINKELDAATHSSLMGGEVQALYPEGLQGLTKSEFLKSLDPTIKSKKLEALSGRK